MEMKIYKALSDKNRLRIIKMLQVKPLCVCEITSILSLATSTVSKHLSILKDAGFIIEEKDGKWVNYLLNPTPSDERISQFLKNIDFWIGNEKQMIADSQKIFKADRLKLCGK